MDTDTNRDNSLATEEDPSVKMFDESSRAFQLIANGEEEKARKEFPMEYFFIKKYVSSGVNELKELLRLRLKLH
jgi:hypothetical protein